MELTALKNIGKEMQHKLNTIGICSAEELKALGSKEAYFRVKIHYPEICLVHLYVLHGAIEDMDYNMLSASTKADLKTFSASCK